MKKPVVSTITPCYGMGKYMGLFLKELPSQTYFDKMEVVLDHNAPTQKELEQVRRFQKDYPGKIRHIVVEKADPIGVSMNRCIRNSSGEFLAIWNVDDLRTPNSIGMQAEKLLRSPAMGSVFGDYRVVYSFGSRKGRLVSHSGLTQRELARRMHFGPFFMFRKSLTEKVGVFDEQLKSGADYDLALRLALSAEAAPAGGLLGYYLNEGMGASTRPGSLQPVERTVIELRYGLFDLVDSFYVPRTVKYNLPFILQEGRWVPVSSLVSGYDELMEKRYKTLFFRGPAGLARRARLGASSLESRLRFLAKTRVLGKLWK
jgi:glycosyltransferase involved in cell wall biosynthesis